MPPDSEDDAEDEDGPPRAEGPPDERILAPEDLDFTRDEKVEQLDDGKFVIGTKGEPRVPPEERAEGTGTGAIPNRSPVPEPSQAPKADHESARGRGSGTGLGAGETGSGDEGSVSSSPSSGRQTDTGTDPEALTGRAVKQFISSELRRTDSLYAYRIAAKTDDVVSHQQLASDDIGMAFDGLLMWYAQQISSDTAVEEALGILLAKSNIRIRYPTKLLTAYLQQHALSPEDDIADLLQAVREENGLVFPPGSQP